MAMPTKKTRNKRTPYQMKHPASHGIAYEIKCSNAAEEKMVIDKIVEY